MSVGDKIEWRAVWNWTARRSIYTIYIKETSDSTSTSISQYP